MGFWKDIADELSSDETLGSLNREQCEAIIDAMTLLVYADGEETFLERTELDHLLHELPWALSNAAEVDEYRARSAASAKVAAALPASLEDAAAGVAERLGPNMDVRKKALKMAATVAYADWDADQHEYDALMVLADAFGIPAPFANAIIEDIEDHTTGVATSGDEGLDEATDPEAIPAPANNTVRAVLSNDFLEGFFTGLFENDELRNLEEDACYAFVDALSLALVADGYPEEEELQEFKTQLERLPFASQDAEHVRARVEIVISTLRQASDEEARDYIASVGARIPSESLRIKAIEMAAAITHADFDISAEEVSILGKMADAFGVDAARVEAIIEQTRVDEDDFLA